MELFKMQFGFSKKIKDKKGGDSKWNHVKKALIRTSSEPTGVKSTQEYDHQDVRTRTNTMGEESVKIQYVTNKAIEENTIKLQQMSADIRTKTVQITELLTTVGVKTSTNQGLRANIRDRDQKIVELEAKISNDKRLLQIEPKYLIELKERISLGQKYEALFTEANSNLTRLESEAAIAITSQKSTNQTLRVELDRAMSMKMVNEAELRKNIDQMECQLKSAQDELTILTVNQEEIEQQLIESTEEKCFLENELKNSSEDNLSLESELEKLQDELARREMEDEMKHDLEQLDQLAVVENQLRDSIMKNNQSDQIIMKKDEELDQRQNRICQMQNDMSERDNQIEKQQNMINDLRYKLKDDAERFESQFEETMMMHNRQLQSFRLQSVDHSQATRLDGEVTQLKRQLKSEKELNETQTVDMAELKNKYARLQHATRSVGEVEKLKLTLIDLRKEVKKEKISRSEDKLDYERIIQNLRGHMLNIYTGNVSPEMTKVLNAALELELRKQKHVC